jgi:hypothetical protein
VLLLVYQTGNGNYMTNMRKGRDHNTIAAVFKNTELTEIRTNLFCLPWLWLRVQTIHVQYTSFGQAVSSLYHPNHNGGGGHDVCLLGTTVVL